MDNIMVDLETLGNGSNSVILAIGAVAFDETGLGDTFYVNVDGQSCVDLGMEIDVSTVMWWLRQGDDAREALQNNGMPIVPALGLFTDYVDYVSEVAGSSPKLWGNGAAFDNTILATAYRRAKMTPPWQFWNDRCYRTMKSTYPQIAFEKMGTAHNALDDARSQALHMSKILAYINGAGAADDSVMAIPQGGTA